MELKDRIDVFRNMDIRHRTEERVSQQQTDLRQLIVESRESTEPGKDALVSNVKTAQALAALLELEILNRNPNADLAPVTQLANSQLLGDLGQNLADTMQDGNPSPRHYKEKHLEEVAGSLLAQIQQGATADIDVGAARQLTSGNDARTAFVEQRIAELNAGTQQQPPQESMMAVFVRIDEFNSTAAADRTPEAVEQAKADLAKAIVSQTHVCHDDGVTNLVGADRMQQVLANQVEFGLLESQGTQANLGPVEQIRSSEILGKVGTQLLAENVNFNLDHLQGFASELVQAINTNREFVDPIDATIARLLANSANSPSAQSLVHEHLQALHDGKQNTDTQQPSSDTSQQQPPPTADGQQSQQPNPQPQDASTQQPAAGTQQQQPEEKKGANGEGVNTKKLGWGAAATAAGALVAGVAAGKTGNAQEGEEAKGSGTKTFLKVAAVALGVAAVVMGVKAYQGRGR